MFFFPSFSYVIFLAKNSFLCVNIFSFVFNFIFVCMYVVYWLDDYVVPSFFISPNTNNDTYKLFVFFMLTQMFSFIVRVCVFFNILNIHWFFFFFQTNNNSSKIFIFTMNVFICTEKRNVENIFLCIFWKTKTVLVVICRFFLINFDVYYHPVMFVNFGVVFVVHLFF